MNRYLAKLPPNLSRILFGAWLIGMAVSSSGSPQPPVHISFAGVNVILGIVLVAAGTLMLLKR
jgi:hypothetical protein